MKAKKLITLALTAAMAMTATITAAAVDLTVPTPQYPTANTGKTEVKATILGVNPGDVSYIVTIPDVVNFETLTQPEDNSEDHFKFVDFTVIATQITGLEANQNVSVYVKGDGAKANDDANFVITNKSDDAQKLNYDVFTKAKDAVGSSESPINNLPMPNASGYLVKEFTETNQELNGCLRINMNQLCGKDLAEIQGEYSGYMVFFTTVAEN